MNRPPLEREPLLPKSQFMGRKLFDFRSPLRYHTQLRGHQVTLCGCVGGIRGVNGWSKLGAKRRRDQRWADRYRCYGRLPDRKDR